MWPVVCRWQQVQAALGWIVSSAMGQALLQQQQQQLQQEMSQLRQKARHGLLRALTGVRDKFAGSLSVAVCLEVSLSRPLQGL